MYISGIEREMLRRKNKGRTKRKLLLTFKYQNSRYDQFVIFRTNCVIFHIIYIYVYLFVDLTFQFFIQISYFIRRNSSRNRLLERGVIAFE